MTETNDYCIMCGYHESRGHDPTYPAVKPSVDVKPPIWFGKIWLDMEEVNNPDITVYWNKTRKEGS